MSLGDYYTTLTLKRKTNTDPLGVGDTLTTVGTFMGYIQQRSGSEMITQNEYGESATHTLYTATDSTIYFGDVIEKSGIAYTVTEPGDPDGVVSLGKHKEIGLKRVIQ